MIIVFAVAGIAALAAFKLNSNKKDVEARVYHPDLDLAATVQADTVKESPFSKATQFLGSFAANREVSIASETSGKVITVGVQEGNQVGQGSLVAKLDDGVLLAQLHSATASLDNAAGTLKRYEQAPNGVSQLQMDNARTQLLTSQAQIEQLKKQIGQYTISAPFSGVITARNFDLGAVVSPGTPLATLTDISSLKLEVSVPERYVAQFKNGMPITVNTDVYPGSSFTGTVWMIASKADASHNYTIKVLVPNNTQHPLKAGMYGNVTIGNTSAHQAICIPRSALIGSARHPQVYVVENGAARVRDIETGAGNATSIEVAKGLHSGEVVVSSGLVNLTDGTKVSIK
ncbi:MexH family multidrug efflux RND transporter periplasmic adaptor subunit [Puia dinghuensis]|uniref:MexH family multidrug efflux RND transporter periplasmic adaptor subunit n=2 Tax=Puia dinghuensis TaxID=1792502 RepID=A0A8J2U9Y0_9BACT|nr:MexH family multidrug efflux RND transporter periplasmic adaptor subunit [Puia dinghuensis]